MNFLLFTGCLMLTCFAAVGGYAQTKPAEPLSKVDSIPTNLQRRLKSTEKQLEAPLNRLKVPADSMVMKQAKLAGKQEAASLLGMVRSPLSQVGQPLKLFEGQKTVSFSQLKAEVDYTYFQDTAGLGLGVFQGLSGMFGYSVDYGVSLMAMPFTMSIRENNGINTLNYTPFQNFYKFNFNQQQYLENIRAQLLQRLSPEALMNSALRRVYAIRDNYEEELRLDVTKIQQDYAKTYHSNVGIPSGATSLSATDMTALRTQMMPGDSIQQYQKNLERLKNMVSSKSSQELAKDSAYKTTLADTKRYEAMEQIYAKIVAYRKKFQDYPLVKQLLSQSAYSPGALKAYLMKPQNLSQVLDDQTSMSMIQRLFVNINKLDMGQNAVQSGELGVQNLVNSGVNMEFQNKSTTVGMIYGKNNNVNNWQQAGLISQVTNEYTNLSGFKLGTGKGSPIDESISFDVFHLNNTTSSLGSSGASSYLPVAPHQDGAISLHTGFPFGAKNMVTLDLSRSFGSYQQTGGPDTSQFGKLPAGGSVFNGTGKSNYAAVLNFTGEFLQTDLKIYAKKIGLGYYNPGNALLHSGETELGLGFARKLLKKKLTLKYDGDYRRQVFDPTGNYIYTSFSNKLQAGYKINRYDKVNVTWQRSDYQSDFYNQAPVFGVNSRLQLDGSYRFIVDGKKVMNNITISRMQTNIPMTTGSNYIDNSLLITSTSTITAWKNPLSLTILSNQSDNNSYYFNTSLFSTEVNYAYGVSGGPRMSSALGYYDNEGWNKQLGARQQVSAMIREKVGIDLQVSYKKAVKVIQTALANQLFVNASMHYTFK